MSLFIIIAPSGSGKTFLAQRMINYGVWEECISHTTRKMRDGEVNGKTYYFVDREDFEDLYSNGHLVERVEYHGNFYGVSKAEIERILNSKEHAFVILEYGGFKQVKELFPDAIGIFINMSKEDCMANMLLRGDSMESALERISTYEEEIAHRGEFDYVVKNIRWKHNETISILKAIVSQYDTTSSISIK